MKKLVSWYQFWMLVKDWLVIPIAKPFSYLRLTEREYKAQHIQSIALSKNQNYIEPCTDAYLNNCIELYGHFKKDTHNRIELVFPCNTVDYNFSYCRIRYSKPEEDFKSFVRLVELRLICFQLSLQLRCSSSCNQSNAPMCAENDEQFQDMSIRILPEIKFIYDFCFSKAAIDNYYNKPNTARTESAWLTIRRTIENIFTFLFCTYPSLLETMNGLVKFRNQPFGNIAFRNSLTAFFKDLSYVKRDWLCWLPGDKNIPMNLTEIAYYDGVRSILEDRTCNYLWMKYKNLNKDFYTLLDNLVGVDTSNYKKDIKEFVRKASSLLNKFRKLHAERNISTLNMLNTLEQSQEEADISIFIKKCLIGLRKFKHITAYLPYYLRRSKNFDDGNTFSDMFWSIIERIAKQTAEYTTKMGWNPEYLNFDLYIWETVRLVEFDRNKSAAIVKYFLEQFKANNNLVYNKFINTYHFEFVGLLKSICDKLTERWQLTAKLPALDKIIHRILSQDCAIEDLMNLYFVIKQAKEMKRLSNSSKGVYSTLGLKYYSLILRHYLKSLNANQTNRVVNNECKHVVVVYAIQIIEFAQPSLNDKYFSERFCMPKYFEQQLKTSLLC